MGFGEYDTGLDKRAIWYYPYSPRSLVISKKNRRCRKGWPRGAATTGFRSSKTCGAGLRSRGQSLWQKCDPWPSFLATCLRHGIPQADL